MARAPREPDPDRYARTFDHCDVLIVGAGPAGLAAALAASQSGARVVVCDENPELGGSLLAEARPRSTARARGNGSRLRSPPCASAPNVRLMTRTQAFGYYAQNFVGLNERLAEADLIADPDLPRERLWQMRAREVVLATGAIERPLVFPEQRPPGRDARRFRAALCAANMAPRSATASSSRPRTTAPTAPRSISRKRASASR